jgi:hypothetical protein
VPLINKITQELAAIGLGPIVLSKYTELKKPRNINQYREVSFQVCSGRIVKLQTIHPFDLIHTV